MKMRKQILICLALVALCVFGMGLKRVIRGSQWFETNVSIQPDAAGVLSALGISGGGGGGGSAPVGTVINTVAPAAPGVPLVFSGLTPTNAVPGYTSEPVVTNAGNATITYTNNSTFLIWNSATNCTITFADGATNGFSVTFKNLGAGSLILTNADGKTFDGVASVSIPTSTISHWIADGTNYRGGRGSPKNLNGPNTVYASPADGSTGLMVPRALVTADISSGMIVANNLASGVAVSNLGYTPQPTNSVLTQTSTNSYTGTGTIPLTSVTSLLAPIANPTFTGTATAPAAAISSLLIGSMGIGTRTTLTEAAGIITCDLSLTNRYWTCSPTGNVTIAISNPSAGNWGNLLLRWPSTNCQFTLAWSSSSSTTNWLSGAPSTNAVANTIGFLGIYPQDGTTNSTIAGYSATQ